MSSSAPDREDTAALIQKKQKQKGDGLTLRCQRGDGVRKEPSRPREDWDNMGTRPRSHGNNGRRLASSMMAALWVRRFLVLLIFRRLILWTGTCRKEEKL